MSTTGRKGVAAVPTKTQASSSNVGATTIATGNRRSDHSCGEEDTGSEFQAGEKVPVMGTCALELLWSQMLALLFPACAVRYCLRPPPLLDCGATHLLPSASLLEPIGDTSLSAMYGHCCSV